MNGVIRIVAVGGDGTANEVLNGYFDEEGKPHNREAEITLVPSGTGNDFRRSLELQSWILRRYFCQWDWTIRHSQGTALDQVWRSS